MITVQDVDEMGVSRGIAISCHAKRLLKHGKRSTVRPSHRKERASDMADMCGDNRFEIIARAKTALLEGTNIDMCPDEMAVIDNILFRCWQMGWLDRYAEQTEPQTELVNDSPILVKDLVDDEFNPYDGECMRCKHLKLKCEFVPSYCKYEPRDEPRTEDLQDWKDRMWAEAVIEPQTDCPWR